MNPGKGRHSKESVSEIQNRSAQDGTGRSWYVYIVRCVDGSLYTGVTTDVARRLKEHNGNNKLAAAYTRARRPVTIVYNEALSTQSGALKREYEIKQLCSSDKEVLVNKSKRLSEID